MGGKVSLAIFAVVFALLALLSFGAVWGTSQPSFCATCHEVQAEYITWSRSNHRKVSCLSCHEAPAGANLIDQKAVSFQRLTKHLSGDYPQPILLKNPISNETCAKCHPVRRTNVLSGQLIMPHATHVDGQKLRCVECHRSVAHAGVAWKPDLKEAREAVAVLANLDPKEYRTPMDVCLSCHDERGVTKTKRCLNCHTLDITPKNHRDELWDLKHAKEIFNSGIAGCFKCHDLKKCSRCHEFLKSGAGS